MKRESGEITGTASERVCENELKKKILDVLERAPKPALMALATVTEEGNPRVRIMTVENDGLTFYTNTFRNSRKISHIMKNNRVALTFLPFPGRMMSPCLVIDAEAEILEDRKLKEARWNESMKKYFKGPDDPDYVVLKLTPRVIEYMDEKGLQKLVL